MGLITNILFPVDFSPSSIAMALYVKRAAALFAAKVSLIHVFDPASYNGFELYLARGPAEIAEEHKTIGRDRLNSFLQTEFPLADHPRILVAGDAAAQITEVARTGFDLIILPTHAGTFRRMLLGSTTAKVLDDADCPVVTSRHAETIAPRPLGHGNGYVPSAWTRTQKECFAMRIRLRRKRTRTSILFMPSRLPIAMGPCKWTWSNKCSLRKDSRRNSVLLICNDELGPARRFGLWPAPSSRRCWRLLGDLTRTR
jgi:nucleotide-binding universal stress UspA family protein